MSLKNYLNTMRQEFLEEGRQEGIEEGIKLGILNLRRSLNFTVEEIADALRLPIEQVKRALAESK